MPILGHALSYAQATIAVHDILTKSQRVKKQILLQQGFYYPRKWVIAKVVRSITTAKFKVEKFD